MHRDRRSPLVAGLVLVVPLAALAAWLTEGWLSRSFGPVRPPSSPTNLSAATASGAPRPSGGSAAPPITGFPPPDGDFSADRLHDRVDGAADALRAAGCKRLLFWKTADPPAEVELLVFGEAQGAAKVLGRDVGPGRTRGPGDEASVAPQSVYFRRGRFYVRLLGDSGSAPDPARLLDLARKLDTALQSNGRAGLP